MEKLKEFSDRKKEIVSTEFKRFLIHEIDWQEQLVIILGSGELAKPRCCFSA